MAAKNLRNLIGARKTNGENQNIAAIRLKKMNIYTTYINVRPAIKKQAQAAQSTSGSRQMLECAKPNLPHIGICRQKFSHEV